MVMNIPCFVCQQQCVCHLNSNNSALISNVGNGVEELEQIAEATDESPVEPVSTEVTENASYGDLFTKEIEELDKQLGINFGPENRLRMIDIRDKAKEGQQDQEEQSDFQFAVSWIKERLGLLGSIVGFEIFSGKQTIVVTYNFHLSLQSRFLK